MQGGENRERRAVADNADMVAASGELEQGGTYTSGKNASSNIAQSA